MDAELRLCSAPHSHACAKYLHRGVGCYPWASEAVHVHCLVPPPPRLTQCNISPMCAQGVPRGRADTTEISLIPVPCLEDCGRGGGGRPISDSEPSLAQSIGARGVRDVGGEPSGDPTHWGCLLCAAGPPRCAGSAFSARAAAAANRKRAARPWTVVGAAAEEGSHRKLEPWLRFAAACRNWKPSRSALPAACGPVPPADASAACVNAENREQPPKPRSVGNAWLPPANAAIAALRLAAASGRPCMHVLAICPCEVVTRDLKLAALQRATHTSQEEQMLRKICHKRRQHNCTIGLPSLLH